MELEPGQRVDRFEVVRQLGRGGIATVFEAVHLDLHTRHAIKVLHFVTPDLRERLVSEGRIQAHLSHPNVCRVTDVVRLGDWLGLVMELVEGPSLDALLTGYRPSLAQVDHLARGIVAGVRAAHGAGLVHRDLKPANVLVEIGSATVVPKVSDFGLAKTLGEAAVRGPSATASGVSMGTPLYMAPEQFRDAKRADVRADVFSLGCLLYELISGTRPFDAPTPFEIYQLVSAGRYRPLSELAPNTPARMVDAVTGALRADPSARWRDCRQLLDVWSGSVADGDLSDVWEPRHRQLLATITARRPEGSDISLPSAGSGSAPSPPLPVPEPPAARRSPIEAAPVRTFGSERRGGGPWQAVVAALGVGVFSAGFGVFLAVAVAAVWVGASGGAEPALERQVEPPRAEPARAEGSGEAVAEASVEPLEAPPAGVSPAAPRPRAPPPARAPARIVVDGFEALLSPTDGAPAVAPGSVDEGRYALTVFFHPGRGTRVLEVTAVAGEQVAIRCNSQLKVCACEPQSRCR